MRVLVTGHRGYIGSVMVGVLSDAGHDVTGFDSDLFEGCSFSEPAAPVVSIRKDVRHVTVDDLYGFDAVIHLAALSNDPLGFLDERCTYDINHLGSVRLARAAKDAGVSRFLFSSSCSLYGAAGDRELDESAAFNPLTPYGASKVRVEADLAALADDSFSPVYLRNATAYGFSPALRGDIVVNNFVGVAFTTGEIVMQSDGTPWRPLVHVDDISRAFLAVLTAPRSAVHNQAFNVGSSSENYQVRDVADIVREIVPGASVRYLPGAGPDPRCYRVNCDKLRHHVPAFTPRWTVRDGVQELYANFVRHGLTAETFDRFTRVKRIRQLLSTGELDASLFWRDAAVVVPA